MKRIYIYLICLISSTTVFGQGEWVSASIDNAALPNSTSLYIETTNSFDANKCDNIVFTIRIPKTAGSAVAISESFHAASIAHITFSIQKLNVDDGTYYYYLINGAGTVQAPAGTIIPTNTPVKLLELTYSGGTNNRIVELANIENDIPGNIFLRPQFYIQINLGDITNYTTMFYGTNGAVPVNNQAVTGDDFVGTLLAVVIPVKFTSFTAEKKQNNAALTWTVENESAVTDHYEVERSVDGRVFTSIQTVLPKNNGRTSNTYSTFDYNISSLINTGRIYYKIKQVDRDGKFAYTETRAIVPDVKGFEVSVYPNPVAKSCKININLAEAGNINMTIADASGKLIKRAAIDGTIGSNEYSLDMTGLAKGTYFIKADCGSQHKTISVVKD